MTKVLCFVPNVDWMHARVQSEVEHVWPSIMEKATTVFNAAIELGAEAARSWKMALSPP